jgi:hypothetical protein
VFDDFTVFIEAKNIYSRIVVIAFLLLFAVQDDQIILGHRPNKMNFFNRIFFIHPCKIIDKSLFSI